MPRAGFLQVGGAEDAALAGKSLLTQGHVVTNVPNAIDTGIFCPTDLQEARKRHGLPVDKKLLLFGAQRITDERKGFSYLAEACDHIMKNHPAIAKDLEVVVLGGDAQRVASALPFPVHVVNYLSDEKDIALLYSAVDLFVTPSLQDNLPNTIVEAMSCGTPCVGFHVGGIPEMIDHRVNGYVANYRDSGDLADGIAWALEQTRHNRLREQAREKAVATYGEATVAQRYLEVYRASLQEKH